MSDKPKHQQWRVVTTARNHLGASTISSDRSEHLRPLSSGRRLGHLWAVNKLDGTTPPGPLEFPPPDGVRFWVVEVPADDVDPHASPFHASQTVDLGFVLRGSVRLEMEDGTAAVLHTGDAFIQTGTVHRWSNAGYDTATLGVVVIGTAGDDREENSIYDSRRSRSEGRNSR